MRTNTGLKIGAFLIAFLHYKVTSYYEL